MVSSLCTHDDGQQSVHTWRWSAVCAHVTMVSILCTHDDGQHSVHTWRWSAVCAHMTMVSSLCTRDDGQQSVIVAADGSVSHVGIVHVVCSMT